MTIISSCWEPAKNLQCTANKAIPSAGKTGWLVEYLSSFKQNHQQRSDLNEEIMNHMCSPACEAKEKSGQNVHAKEERQMGCGLPSSRGDIDFGFNILIRVG